MKKYWLALAFCGFAPQLATAQEVKTPVVSERVPYPRAILKGLRRLCRAAGRVGSGARIIDRELM